MQSLCTFFVPLQIRKFLVTLKQIFFAFVCELSAILFYALTNCRYFLHISTSSLISHQSIDTWKIIKENFLSKNTRSTLFVYHKQACNYTIYVKKLKTWWKRVWKYSKCKHNRKYGKFLCSFFFCSTNKRLTRLLYVDAFHSIIIIIIICVWKSFRAVIKRSNIESCCIYCTHCMSVKLVWWNVWV